MVHAAATPPLRFRVSCGLVESVPTKQTPGRGCCLLNAVVANRDGELDETVAEIEAILRAEKNRVSRRSLQQ